jgi:hypothetical protein
MSDSRLLGTIRRAMPERGFAIANVYTGTSTQPIKYFVHISNFIQDSDAGTVLACGVRISFVPGAPRSTGELPVALQIEIIPAPGQKVVGGVN